MDPNGSFDNGVIPNWLLCWTFSWSHVDWKPFGSESANNFPVFNGFFSVLDINASGVPKLFFTLIFVGELLILLIL